MNSLLAKSHALCFSAILLSVGCTSTSVEELRQGETGIENHQSVVLLGRRQVSSYETEAEFVECVGERLAQGENALNVIPEQDFLDAVFPWFEPRTAPLRVADLARIMTEDSVSQTIYDFGIRYIVWLDGHTERLGRTGSISCTVAPGLTGCFGFGSWEDDANFLARVWDVNEFNSVGTISAEASGQSYVPAVVVPIPLIARVESNACQRLGDQLKAFVHGG